MRAGRLRIDARLGWQCPLLRSHNQMSRCHGSTIPQSSTITGRMNNTDATAPAARQLQFGIQACLVMIVALALLLGYLRSFGGEVVARCAVAIAAGLILGGVVGWRAGKPADTMFWSTVGGLFGYFVSLDVPLYHASFGYVWPLAGAVVGAVAALPAEGRLVARTMFAMAAGCVSISGYALIAFGWEPTLAADIICATLGGVLFGIAVELAVQFEHRTQIPREYLATALVALAIVGHWAIPQLLPWLS